MLMLLIIFNKDVFLLFCFVLSAGIAFLRGFQVSVQALGGTAVACQLLLFSRNVSLSAAHAQMV